MKSLVIAGEYPWPVNSGSRIRLETILRGLGGCGTTELFSIVPESREDIDPAEGVPGLDRVAVVPYDGRPERGLGRLAALARTATPIELSSRARPVATRALVRFASGSYDLLWYFGVRPWALLDGWDLAPALPAVLDVVDLEDRKIAARLAMPRPRAEGVGGRLRTRAARAVSGEEVRRWARLQARASARCAATVVCSALDAERAVAGGLVRVEVVPNAYDLVGSPLGQEDVAAQPTVLFQGTLRYPPNAEAARFLVDEVAPELRRRVPGVRIRLVGTSTPSLERLDDPPAVSVVGRVADMDDELALADLVVVPVRFGSGTRLKILEAFAHRIPVVSTTLGAEGLGVEDGVHLLLGDTAAELAAACARLLADTGLRARVVAAAQALYEARFTEELVETRVAEVARQVAAGLKIAPRG
jgi:glycosyltransferase involved in cell wall biosynthesis